MIALPVIAPLVIAPRVIAPLVIAPLVIALPVIALPVIALLVIALLVIALLVIAPPVSLLPAAQTGYHLTVRRTLAECRSLLELMIDEALAVLLVRVKPPEDSQKLNWIDLFEWSRLGRRARDRACR